MITINVKDLKEESRSLSEYLRSEIPGQMDAKGGNLLLEPKEKVTSTKAVKMLVKRFLHRKGLSEVYRVTEERNVIRITKRKNRQNRSAERKGVGPSSYQTVPFYFPNPP